MADVRHAPAGVVAELERGLRWHESGRSGDGLKPETVAWARRLANGERISLEKAVKMRAWLARHRRNKQAEGYRILGNGVDRRMSRLLAEAVMRADRGL